MKLQSTVFACLLAFFLFISDIALAQSPPFSGTIFLDPDIITPEDPSTFLSLTDAGRGLRVMFDRRANDWVTRNAYLFIANFDDELELEIQVNPEFGSSDAALKEAEKYAPVLGQLPTVLRKDAKTVWIHKGIEPFGGGNNNFLIHTGQADLYINDGILEETLVHEGAHTSLDNPHASSAAWKAAQAADPTFISTYARDFPDREDIAETFLLYLALRFRADRISEELKNTILETIPNRIAYFDGLMLDMHPISFVSSTTPLLSEVASMTLYPNPVRHHASISYILPQSGVVDLSLHNYQGQLVQSLLSSNYQTAGLQEIILDAGSLAKGVYFIQLQTTAATAVRKIVVD